MIRRNIPLEPFKPSANSIVFTDASLSGVGYVFFQATEDGKIKIIACGSTGYSQIVGH